MIISIGAAVVAAVVCVAGFFIAWRRRPTGRHNFRPFPQDPNAPVPAHGAPAPARDTRTTPSATHDRSTTSAQDSPRSSLRHTDADLGTQKKTAMASLSLLESNEDDDFGLMDEQARFISGTLSFAAVEDAAATRGDIAGASGYEANTGSYNFGIVGNVKAGKSSLVNSLCGRTAGDPGAARAGVTECTRFPAPYQMVNNEHITFWDLPGGGVLGCSIRDYYDRFRLGQLDGLIIVYSTTMLEFDLDIAATAIRAGLPVYFVRSQYDISLRESMKAEHRLLQRAGQPRSPAVMDSLRPAVGKRLVAELRTNLTDQLDRYNRDHACAIFHPDTTRLFVVNRDSLLLVQQHIARVNSLDLSAVAASVLRAASSVAVSSIQSLFSQGTTIAPEILGAAREVLGQEFTAAAEPDYLDDGCCEVVDELNLFVQILNRAHNDRHDPSVATAYDAALSSAQSDDVLFPLDLFCPISNQVFVDPVITADGHTYERAAIQEWFDHGKKTSPVTNAVLDNVNLTPNVHVKSRVAEIRDRIAEANRARSRNP